ncbi:hypothetical protein ACFSQ7_42940 [Paenibacillus rhizoplanae]
MKIPVIVICTGMYESLLVQERGCGIQHSICDAVAPRAGEWIEIPTRLAEFMKMVSLLVQERGLKYQLDICGQSLHLVAPRAGAWIEIVW